MPTILIQACELYLEHLHQLDTSSDESFAKHFPALGAADFADFRTFIAGLDDLVLTLCDFIAQRDNLPMDRLLASSALFYLINPFDIIPDEEGLAGYLDDALMVYRLSEHLEAPSTAIEQALRNNQRLARYVQSRVPTWLGDAIGSAVHTTLQQRLTLSAPH